MSRFAAVGEAMIELSMHGNTAQVGVAGDTLNTAIYLKRTAPDIEVDYMTCLGDDPFSDRIEDFIAQQGIGTTHCTRLTGRSPGLYAISTSPTGERSFTYWRSTSAAREVFKSADGYDFGALAGYDLVYLSGISVAILPVAARKALLDWLSQNPVRFAFDSNYRPRLWESKAVAREVIGQFWERSDILLPSIDDEMALFDEDETAVVRRFSRYRGRGALKRGAEGPLAIGSNVAQNYSKAADVVDTTAAGDSFNGAYLGALLSGTDQAEALRRGHRCAATVVRYRGAIIPREIAL
jgi:2-dehydro-3-deoxygluconokinase